MKYCKFCNKEFLDSEGLKLGGHTANCSMRSKEFFDIKNKKISEKLKLQIMSDETKKKISESRKKYLLEHPEQVPYKLNHKHKETYPERYFKRILKGFVCQYRPEGTLYEIDFANVEKKIAVEIDGEQHYVDKRIVVHDIKRTKILEDLGWKIIRVRWSHYKKLEKYQKLYVISQLMNESMNINDKLKEFIDLRKETTIINKQKIIDDKRKLIDNKIEKIILSGIDCTKYGWVELMKKLLNQKKSPVSWIAKYMPDYYVNCYKR